MIDKNHYYVFISLILSYNNNTDMEMTQYIALILLVVLVIIIYLIATSNKYSSLTDQTTESFTALRGIESPLTTYDDYGTFNFILQTDDLPYYDPTYDDMGCAYKDYVKVKGQGEKCGNIMDLSARDENFNHDSFIDFGGRKVRRELVPANYNKEWQYADADFDRNQLHLAIKKDRPQASAVPPQPHNVYFNKIPRN
jgi:hypothetical protein